MIEIQHVSKIYQINRAVDDVTFTVQPGVVYGLLGENGAGKTTLMRMIAMVLQPTSGIIKVCGENISNRQEGLRSRIGALFEGGLYDRLTAEENIVYFGRLHGLDTNTIKTRVNEMFVRLDMEKYRHKHASELSKGTKQKVALIRTTIHDPDVLLFDEPTSGLDVTASRAVYEFVEEKKKAGKTILFSSHIMSEVERVCERIGIIHGGRLIVEDSLEGLRASYGENLEESFIKIIGGKHP